MKNRLFQTSAVRTRAQAGLRCLLFHLAKQFVCRDPRGTLARKETLGLRLSGAQKYSFGRRNIEQSQ